MTYKDQENVMYLMQRVRDLFSDETNNFRADISDKMRARLEVILDLLMLINIDITYERRPKK